MKILRFSESKIAPAVAERYVNPLNNKVYYNLNHGSKGDGLWRWFAGLDSRHFKDTGEDFITLDGDNYNLIPVYQGGKILHDKKGNICYNVTIDSDISHRRDIILLWSIPSRGYYDVRYTYSGEVDLIGEGISGKQRGDSTIAVPAPVLEITGNCTLEWTGYNRENKLVKQVINYNYGEQWNISPIEIVE